MTSGFIEDATTGWWQVVATTTSDRAELVGDRLWVAGTVAIEEQAVADRIILIAGFPNEAEARAAMEAVRPALASSDAVTVRPVLDDGLDAWREHAAAIETERFVLVPAWTDAPVASPDDDHRITLLLDPGRTFGSGSHPTTRGCLDLLAHLDVSSADVLDVGTGSGVLAVAAARLGARRVVAVDIDPASPAAVTDNADRNGVGSVIDASNAPLAQVLDGDGPFPVVLANLLAPVIRELHDDLLRAVAPGGRLIVAGLLADRWHDGVANLVEAGFVADDPVIRDGWVAVGLTRPAAE